MKEVIGSMAAKAPDARAELILAAVRLAVLVLFEERGIEQLLSPVMIFFPTTYSMSNIELVRHLIEPAFFFGIGMMKNSQISDNFKNGYLSQQIKIMLDIILTGNRK